MSVIPPTQENPLKIVIWGDPPIKKNQGKTVTNRATGKKVRIPPKKFSDWEKDAKKQLLGKMPTTGPIDYPINLQCVFYRQKEIICDLSNLYEAPQDVLKDMGIIKDDNYTIVASHDGSRVEIDRTKPRMELTITPKS